MFSKVEEFILCVTYAAQSAPGRTSQHSTEKPGCHTANLTLSNPDFHAPTAPWLPPLASRINWVSFRCTLARACTYKDPMVPHFIRTPPDKEYCSYGELSTHIRQPVDCKPDCNPKLLGTFNAIYDAPRHAQLLRRYNVGRQLVNTCLFVWIQTMSQGVPWLQRIPSWIEAVDAGSLNSLVSYKAVGRVIHGFLYFSAVVASCSLYYCTRPYIIIILAKPDYISL